MELKTKVSAEEGSQDLVITREFDLPVDLLFKAYTEAEFVEQWMGTQVLKMESRKHGSYVFETKDSSGNIVFQANGVIHDLMVDQKITRTFEMANSPFPVQLEFLDFQPLNEETSLLTIQIVYKSIALRNQMMKLPFASGLNMAHNRLQNLFSNNKN